MAGGNVARPDCLRCSFSALVMGGVQPAAFRQMLAHNSVCKAPLPSDQQAWWQAHERHGLCRPPAQAPGPARATGKGPTGKLA
jgi:hypothetical protein